ncbi:polyphosphate kinase [[Clostridium] fimetarium]|uniref:Polyphosphate kinase n=1 Tax=[Clostridium] fimetarium TaxID=99656 RepID=A0A1I0QGW5_9FIRM|nr:polyphosphate kinase [[Clostridium] fimetarium]
MEVIRGICCLKPGVAMYTDNIEVRSIVGRFLEHSRIYCFGEGEDTKIYISSADMMTRNTTHRVEIATPILDEKIADRLTDMLRIMLQDNVKSRLLKPDGTYIYFENDQQKIDSQMCFYDQAYNN